MSAKVLLSTEHLYATHPGRPMVLTDVNVSFRAGVRVAILGANGSGKTTLMRCLSGSLKPAKGHVKRSDTVVGYGRAQLREHRRAVQLVLHAAQAGRLVGAHEAGRVRSRQRCRFS